jgi:hypothetical protein
MDRCHYATREDAPDASYYESLMKPNERLTARGSPLVATTIVPHTFEIMDLMEMEAAGLLPAAVRTIGSPNFGGRTPRD